MGWVTDDGLHEGHLVAVLADGRDATAADNPHGDNTAWWCFDGTDGRPRATGVRAGCDCYAESVDEVVRTWRGSTVHPVYFGDDDRTDGTDGEEMSGPYAEWWTVHVAPATSTAVPGEIADLLDTVRVRLAGLGEQRPLAALTAVARLEGIAAAAAVRAAGAVQHGGGSWADIGGALGVSRQAAHQRLARRVAALDEQVPGTRTGTTVADPGEATFGAGETAVDTYRLTRRGEDR
ncbi:hypothetical protein [Streptomyces ortus]|uniref:Uncharacterized protein n=1 Tax=Streptomyces ortus TaxID=2867268 RepID=A0ABT3UWU1_9ACTN|nr:hypothetical protein [Streptomyces ortus]MCX4231798.1 hypothetical protein [Streptomyces ortus]